MREFEWERELFRVVRLLLLIEFVGLVSLFATKNDVVEVLL